MGKLSNNPNHKYDIRHLQEKDFPQLSDLYRTVFKIERDESFWRWKYLSNPAGKHMMVVAVEPHTGRVIGQTGTIPAYILFDGKKILGCQSCDIVVLPEYQKGGLFFRLHDLATKMLIDREVRLIIAFSITRTLKISIRALKFKNVFPIRRMVRILNPKHFINQKVKVSWVASVLGSISGQLLRIVYPALIRLPEGYRLNRVSFFDSRYDTLMALLATTNKIMVYKDSKYLNWRYTQCPIFNYVIFAIERDDEVAGFTVISIQDEDIRRAYILELIADQNQPELFGTLLNQAIRYCYDAKADTINSWTPEHSSFWNLQRRKGFVVKETNHNLITRPHCDKEVTLDITDPNIWHISMGDSDYH